MSRGNFQTDVIPHSESGMLMFPLLSRESWKKWELFSTIIDLANLLTWCISYLYCTTFVSTHIQCVTIALTVTIGQIIVIFIPICVSQLILKDALKTKLTLIQKSGTTEKLPNCLNN